MSEGEGPVSRISHQTCSTCLIDHGREAIRLESEGVSADEDEVPS